MKLPFPVDRKLLLRGYLALGVVFVAIVIWLVIAGAPSAPALASVSVPVEIITPPPESSLTPSLPEPRQAPNGMASARPFDMADKRPRIAIVITGLGPSQTAARAAAKLPPETSLAFLPFANDSAPLAEEARLGGHEILMDIPMEPATYPDDDPGPEALMTTVSDAENIRRLNWNLARAAGYVGIVNFMGSRFTVAEEKLQPVFTALHDHGLLVVDTNANALTAVPGLARQMKVPFALADLTIDNSASRDAIDQNLAKLEQIAKDKGKAVGIAGTYPVTFERIDEWAKSLASKGIAFAPISAVVTSPKG